MPLSSQATWSNDGRTIPKSDALFLFAAPSLRGWCALSLHDERHQGCVQHHQNNGATMPLIDESFEIGRVALDQAFGVIAHGLIPGFAKGQFHRRRRCCKARLCEAWGYLTWRLPNRPPAGNVVQAFVDLVTLADERLGVG
jgi:hypothetical protein